MSYRTVNTIMSDNNFSEVDDDLFDPTFVPDTQLVSVLPSDKEKKKKNHTEKRWNEIGAMKKFIYYLKK